MGDVAARPQGLHQNKSRSGRVIPSHFTILKASSDHPYTMLEDCAIMRY